MGSKGNKKLGFLVILIIIFNFSLAACWLVNGEMLFHSDIARDFYLIKDIVDNKNLTLIGARAGGLTGWFHGPLWLYINLPAYVIGEGNPLVVGWFWFLLHTLTCGLVYIIAKKIFDQRTAILSTIVYSAITALDVHGYLNLQGALMVFPIFYYFYNRYWENNKIKDLVISLFLVGLMIQFQIAFGAPILVLTVIDNIVRFIKRKDIRIFIAYLVLLIPLSTYILFELKHNFLQIRAALSTENNGEFINIMEKLKSWPMWVYGSFLILSIRNRESKINLFLFLILGYFGLTLLYPGKLMSYYYLPFLPVVVMVLVNQGESVLKKRIYWLAIVAILVLTWSRVIEDNNKFLKDFNDRDWSTWRSQEKAADFVMEKCSKDSGYFVYTADLYGYNLRYAIEYKDKNKELSLNKKRPITCLVMGPTVKENQSGRENWKSGDVKISGELVDMVRYHNGITIEKYRLSEKDILVTPNSNLIDGIFFR